MHKPASKFPTSHWRYTQRCDALSSYTVTKWYELPGDNTSHNAMHATVEFTSKPDAFGSSWNPHPVFSPYSDPRSTPDFLCEPVLTRLARLGQASVSWCMPRNMQWIVSALELRVATRSAWESREARLLLMSSFCIARMPIRPSRALIYHLHLLPWRPRYPLHILPELCRGALHLTNRQTDARSLELAQRIQT